MENSDVMLWVGLGLAALFLLWLALYGLKALALGALGLFSAASEGGLIILVLYFALWLVATPLMLIASVLVGLPILRLLRQEKREEQRQRSSQAP